jgi:predicted NBD/HSP70 family sugar kinase
MNHESAQDITGTHIKGIYAVARAEVEAMGETRKRLEALGATVGGKAGTEARQAVEAALQGAPKAVAAIEGAASHARQALRNLNLWVATVAFLIGVAIGGGLSLGLAYRYLLMPQLDTLSIGQDAIQQLLKDARVAPAHGGRAKR